MNPAVVKYVNAIPAEHRALFDRIHRLILDACPDANVVLSYKMPTYQAGPGGCTSACGNTGYPCTGGSTKATAASPSATRSCTPAPAPSASAPTPPRPSPTTTSGTLPAPPSHRADVPAAGAGHHHDRTRADRRPSHPAPTESCDRARNRENCRDGQRWAPDFPADGDVVIVRATARAAPAGMSRSDSPPALWQQPWLVEESSVIIGTVGFKGPRKTAESKWGTDWSRRPAGKDWPPRPSASSSWRQWRPPTSARSGPRPQSTTWPVSAYWKSSGSCAPARDGTLKMARS